MAFGLSLVCCAAAGFEILFTKEPRSRWIRLGVRCGLLLLALLAIADFCDWDTGLSEKWQLPVRVVVIGFGLVAIVVIVRVTGVGGRRAVCNFGALAILAASWTSLRVVELTFPFSELKSSYVQSANERLAPLDGTVAVTDEGHAVPLYHCPEPAGTNNNSAEPETTISPELQALVIAVAPPSDQTNCHGWVFTGGKFVIRGFAVDSILADNGYWEVDAPSAGDLIVYRDGDGVPTHTGIVKATGGDGFVLIESKWGFDGLFLHEPQNQCYAQEFAYYRSPRSGHLLRLEGSTQVAKRPAPRDVLVLSAAMTGS